jgi:hypothetical protein
VGTVFGGGRYSEDLRRDKGGNSFSSVRDGGAIVGSVDNNMPNMVISSR